MYDLNVLEAQYRDRDFLVRELYVCTVAAACGALLLGVAAAVLSLHNVAADPAEAACALPGLIVLNLVSLAFSATSALTWLAQFFATLRSNVLIRYLDFDLTQCYLTYLLLLYASYFQGGHIERRVVQFRRRLAGLLFLLVLVRGPVIPDQFDHLDEHQAEADEAADGQEHGHHGSNKAKRQPHAILTTLSFLCHT